MADRVIRALITADPTEANAGMQAAADQARAASAQAQEAMEAQAAAADATSADISAAMEAMEADYAGAGLASGDMAASVDAAMADLKASLLTTDGIANTTAGDVAAAMQGVGTESEVAAERMSASMAQIDGAVALASSDTATASAEMDASMESAGTAAEAAKTKFMGFDLATLGPLALAAAAAGVGYESLKMADEFDKATNSLSADAGISEKAAQRISKSFLDASNTTIYSATDITSAYAQVAGQLGTVEGHALTAAEAQRVMNAAQNLATASNTSLSQATTSLAAIMQAYGQKASSAAADSNALFNTSRLTGQGVDTVQAAVQKLVAGLGVAAPPLGQVGGLLADLAAHGETGRKSVSAVTSAMNTLIKATQGTQAAQQQAQAVFKQMPPSLQAMTKELEDGQMGAYDYQQTTENLSTSQAQLATSFLAAESSVTSSQSKLGEMGITVETASGKFVGMASVIAQLHKKIQGETQAQALATIGQVVGTTAAQKLYSTIEAGPAAYDKDVAAVTKANSAHKAAEKQLQNLGDMWKEVLTHAEDFAINIGEAVMPILTDLGHVVSAVTSYFSENKNAVNAAKIILGALGITLAVMVAPSLFATAAAAWAAAAPFLAIAAPIVAVAAGFFLLYTHVALFRDIVNDIIGVLKGALVVGFDVAKTAVESIVTAFQTGIQWGGHIVTFFEGLPGDIKSAFSILAGAITSPFKSAFDLVANLWNSTLGKLSFSIPGWVPVIGGDKFSLPKIPVLDTGGMVTGSGIAYLHAGEVVVNQQQQASALGGVSMPVTINALSNEPSDIMNALAMYVQRNGRVPAQVRRAFGGTA